MKLQVLILVSTPFHFEALQPQTSTKARKHFATSRQDYDPGSYIDEATGEKDGCLFDRRGLLISMAATTFLPLTAQAAFSSNESSSSLEDLRLGRARWDPSGRTEIPLAKVAKSTSTEVPPVFCTYLARFLLHFDEGASSWWNAQNELYARLPEDQRSAKLGRAFGSFAASLQTSLESFVPTRPTPQEAYLQILEKLSHSYHSDKDDVTRHVGLLCALLPERYQPSSIVKQFAGRQFYLPPTDGDSSPVPPSLIENLATLLPPTFQTQFVQEGNYLTIHPALSTYSVGVGEEFGQVATATTFGPLSSQVLTRELPKYSPSIYALFGISGATGCALTHTVVIPLDVIKTKAQTNPNAYANILEGANRIIQQEGLQGLLTGAQATLAGYFWYGLSVYPSYTFFKRFLGGSVLPADVSAVHTNDIALVSGALAAVLASLGLTPLEAARIRVVADPDRYKRLGLVGTLGIIAQEDAELGWKAVYSGLPSLMTRQVIFGSVKFLAFERACESIYGVWPSLRDATWTALLVSLVAGGFSGALSSVVSQPADAVLTYVAQKSEDKGGGSLGVLEGCQLMVEESGVSSLFRGLGSRCVWAGSIIAGQFLLYDVFRNFFRITPDDLSQILKIDL